MSRVWAGVGMNGGVSSAESGCYGSTDYCAIGSFCCSYNWLSSE